MKVFSIAFQSVLYPDKIAMYTAINDTPIEAHTDGIKRVIKDFGDLMWRANMATAIEIQITPETRIEPQTNLLSNKEVSMMETNDIKKTSENWLMSTIINNKDNNLFSASKPYLSNSEILFIEEKIK